jgi:hypothetical protein
VVNFFAAVLGCLTSKISSGNSGLQTYYQTEFGYNEGQRLYIEYLRNSGRFR